MLAAALLVAVGCNTSFVNATTSLGGEVAGERGTIDVIFINNTSFRPIFTFGTYDQTSEDFQPEWGQFVLDEGGRVLEANDSSDSIRIACARVMSVGGERLLELVERNLPNAQPDQAAYVEGVNFFDSDGSVEAGHSPSLDVLLGEDFLCGSVLIFRLEFDDFGPDRFRVDFEVIPPSGTP